MTEFRPDITGLPQPQGYDFRLLFCSTTADGIFRRLLRLSQCADAQGLLTLGARPLTPMHLAQYTRESVQGFEAALDELESVDLAARADGGVRLNMQLVADDGYAARPERHKRTERRRGLRPFRTSDSPGKAGRVLALANSTCARCRIRAASSHLRVTNQVLPRDGGDHAESNLFALCVDCHQAHTAGWSGGRGRSTTAAAAVSTTGGAVVSTTGGSASTSIATSATTASTSSRAETLTSFSQQVSKLVVVKSLSSKEETEVSKQTTSKPASAREVVELVEGVVVEDALPPVVETPAAGLVVESLAAAITPPATIAVVPEPVVLATPKSNLAAINQPQNPEAPAAQPAAFAAPQSALAGTDQPASPETPITVIRADDEVARIAQELGPEVLRLAGLDQDPRPRTHVASWAVVEEWIKAGATRETILDVITDVMKGGRKISSLKYFAEPMRKAITIQAAVSLVYSGVPAQKILEKARQRLSARIGDTGSDVELSDCVALSDQQVRQSHNALHRAVLNALERRDMRNGMPRRGEPGRVLYLAHCFLDGRDVIQEDCTDVSAADVESDPDCEMQQARTAKGRVRERLMTQAILARMEASPSAVEAGEPEVDQSHDVDAWGDPREWAAD